MWGLELALKCVSRWTCVWQGCKNDLGRPPVSRPKQEPGLWPLTNPSASAGRYQPGPQRDCHLHISWRKERKRKNRVSFQEEFRSAEAPTCIWNALFPMVRCVHDYDSFWCTDWVSGRHQTTVWELKGKRRWGQRKGPNQVKETMVYDEISGPLAGHWTSELRFSFCTYSSQKYDSSYITPSPLTRHFHTYA